jgi:hypothetical protein
MVNKERYFAKDLSEMKHLTGFSLKMTLKGNKTSKK